MLACIDGFCGGDLCVLGCREMPFVRLVLGADGLEVVDDGDEEGM